MAHILVADDNAINQRAAQVVLQKAGHMVEVAANGLQAVAACYTRDFDLVLMDYRMPEMDGLEAVRHIRQWARSQPVIIAVTAAFREGFREHCLASGMDDYLSKPYHLQQLVQVVHANLERSC